MTPLIINHDMTVILYVMCSLVMFWKSSVSFWNTFWDFGEPAGMYLSNTFVVKTGGLWIHSYFQMTLAQIQLTEFLSMHVSVGQRCMHLFRDWTIFIPKSAGYGYLSPVSNLAACRPVCQLIVQWMYLCPSGIGFSNLPFVTDCQCPRVALQKEEGAQYALCPKL